MLPDTAFLVVQKGGRKVGGKTIPKSKRKLPVRNLQGHIDAKHVRNALGRLGQPRTQVTDAERAEAQIKARRMLRAVHVLRAVDEELLKPFVAAGRRRAA